MNELKERKQMDPEYMWDLSTLFTSDEEWEKAFNEISSLTDQLESYAGNLNSARIIREFLDASTNASRKMENVFTYASLRNCEDTRDSKGQQMYAKSYGAYVNMMSRTAFAEPEILANDEDQLNSMIASEELKDYRFYLENKIRMKKHTLSAQEEKIIASFGEAINASGNVAETLMDADMKFADVKDENGEDVKLSSSNFILLQEGNDRTLRKNSFESYYQSYADLNNTFAASYSGCVKAATAEAAVRHFPSSIAMSLANDNIPLSVYENLIDTVHKHIDLLHRYVALRKKILQLDELHYYDLYAPLAKDIHQKYTYEEAQKLVLDAVKPLGENYGKIVQSAFDNHWIDVYPNEGKRGGAFSSGTYDSNPYILTNFTGTLDSVSTIAHEMGHSLHTWHTNHTQPAQYASYTMFVAEVASTVNENLLIEQLLSKETDPMIRLALLNQYMEGFKGTVYRQTKFAEFEKEAHAMCERGEALNGEALNALYEKLVRFYYGEELTFDDKVKYEWSRIPHFYMPFYVFVYATGYCSAAAISEGILEGREGALDNYLEFLSMGGSAYPVDELIHAGVDLNTPAPIETALKKFEKVLSEAEQIVSQL